MNNHKTHFIYLCPSDRALTATGAISNCAQHLRAWLRWQMGNYKTITLNDPIVQFYQSSHEALWYSTNDPALEPGMRWVVPRPSTDTSGWFWENVLDDAAYLAGAGFGQEFATYVIYIDAPLAPGQYVGGACVGFSGCAVLPEEDVAAVQGKPTVHHYSQCRELGGCGHELLHTFGVPHPDGDPNWNKALMGVGYPLYPNCILTQAEKDQLNLNPFFEIQARAIPKPGLCPFNDGIAMPRPRPVVRPRPVG